MLYILVQIDKECLMGKPNTVYNHLYYGLIKIEELYQHILTNSVYADTWKRSMIGGTPIKEGLSNNKLSILMESSTL